MEALDGGVTSERTRQLERLRQAGVIRTRRRLGEEPLSIEENVERLRAFLPRLEQHGRIDLAALATWGAGEAVERRALELAFGSYLERCVSRLGPSLGADYRRAAEKQGGEPLRRVLARNVRTKLDREPGDIPELVEKAAQALAAAAFGELDAKGADVAFHALGLPASRLSQVLGEGRVRELLREPSPLITEALRGAASDATMDELERARSDAHALWAVGRVLAPSIVEAIRFDEIQVAWLALALVVVRRDTPELLDIALGFGAALVEASLRGDTRAPAGEEPRRRSRLKRAKVGATV